MLWPKISMIVARVSLTVREDQEDVLKASHVVVSTVHHTALDCNWGNQGYSWFCGDIFHTLAQLAPRLTCQFSIAYEQPNIGGKDKQKW